MERPIVSGINMETGEVVTREMTDSEYAQYLEDIANSAGLYEVPPAE
jgi:hypothetical protein